MAQEQDSSAKKLTTAHAGYYTVTPWIIVKGASDLIDFLTAAFGAEELARVPNEDGTLGHAEVRIGDSVVMMFDTGRDWPATPAFMRLYVEDGEATMKRAVDAGGTIVTEITDLAFGDRVGRVRDPFGNIWWIQQRVEELAPDEMGRRMADPQYSAAMQYVEDSLHKELTHHDRATGELHSPNEP